MLLCQFDKNGIEIRGKICDMVKFIHLGTGGTHTKHVTEELRRASRVRSCRLYNSPATSGDYTVVLTENCHNILSSDDMKRILAHETVIFVIGDANGVPDSITNMADETYSLCAIPLTHQLQALILAESLCTVLLEIHHDTQTA